MAPIVMAAIAGVLRLIGMDIWFLRTRAGEILQKLLDCGMWLVKWLEPSRLFSGLRLREKKQ